MYEGMNWDDFVGRITGGLYTPRKRRRLLNGDFYKHNNSILICTQQSLCESISVDFVDHIFLNEFHWNFSRMSQFAFRFIWYTSTEMKHIYFVNVPDTIETNLLFILVAKERMLRFIKGEEIGFTELFYEMGFDFAKHQNAMFKKQTKDGTELQWSKQLIA